MVNNGFALLSKISVIISNIISQHLDLIEIFTFICYVRSNPISKKSVSKPFFAFKSFAYNSYTPKISHMHVISHRIWQGRVLGNWTVPN